MASLDDPSSWPLLIKLLAGWGPLGVWAGVSEYRRRSSEAALAAAQVAHHASRDHCDAELREVNERHDAEIKTMSEAHLNDLRQVNDEHRKQLNDVTGRMFRLIERQSNKAHELADKVDEKKPGGSNGGDSTPP